MKILVHKFLTFKHMGLLGALLLPMLTFVVQVQNVPVCEYADTEVATNLP